MYLEGLPYMRSNCMSECRQVSITKSNFSIKLSNYNVCNPVAFNEILQLFIWNYVSIWKIS